VSALERRIDELMDRLTTAGDDQAARAGVLEDYLGLARVYAGTEAWFEIGAYSEDLAEAYLVLDHIDDAARVVREATAAGCGEDAVMLCWLAEKLIRGGHEPAARGLWAQAHADYPDDVWVYVQAGIEYGDLGDHVTALAWLPDALQRQSVARR
jgi:tetratricopeptide (TPR) repeat protein